MKSNESILTLEHIVKQFPGVKAVDDVSLEIRKGEIHAILGHNGAGKSTLVKIISGAYRKDSGRMIFDGEDVDFTSPADGIAHGVGMVYQELDLIPYLSASENIFLGQKRFLNRAGLIDKEQRKQEAERLIERFAVDIDLDVPVNTLSISKQQLITIAKVLSRRAKLMIFDEPTAALNDSEVEKLFSIMDMLTSDGIAIVWITHRLDEVFRMANRVTLMRDGKWLSTHGIKDINMQEIVEAMTGQTETEPQAHLVSHATDEVVLSCDGLSMGKTYHDISFDMHKGEVLGITGLIGCGSTEIAKSLFAVLKPDSGRIYIKGKAVHALTPHKATKLGIAYVSEDRKASGLNLVGSVRYNISITILNAISKLGFIQFREENALTDEMIQKLKIRVSGPMQLSGTLSGGNQQKVVIAKWLLRNSEIFIMCEPTRGIDVGTKREIHRMIRDLAESGKSVLVVSSEIEEILDTCDRILVLYEGKLKAERSSNQCVKSEMMNLMYGVD